MARERDGYVDRLDYNCITGSLATGTRRLQQDCQIGTQGGESMWAVRGVLRWLVGDRVENSISFDATEDESENPAAKQVFTSPLWAGTNAYITGPEEYTNYEDYISRPTGTASTPFVMPATTPLDVHGFSNNLNVQFTDSLSFQSITALRESVAPFSTPADVTPATVSDQAWRLTHEQFTQEFRLNGGSTDGVEWTVGLFHYDADGVSEGRVNLPGGLALGGGGLNLEILFRDPVKTESDSAFAHAAFHPGDTVTITTGVRYTDDLKSFTFNRWDWTGQPHPVLGALVDFNSSYEGDHTDYRVAVDWQFADNMMCTARFRRAIRAAASTRGRSSRRRQSRTIPRSSKRWKSVSRVCLPIIASVQRRDVHERFHGSAAHADALRCVLAVSRRAVRDVGERRRRRNHGARDRGRVPAR